MNRYYSRLKQFVIFKGADAGKGQNYRSDKWYFQPRESDKTTELFSDGYDSPVAAIHAADDWEIEFA